jgi:hypothetical protein
MPEATAKPKIEAKKGLEFVHANWLDEQKNPLRCRVTAVRRGVVYWKGVYEDGSLGGCTCCDADQFSAKVKSIISRQDGA